MPRARAASVLRNAAIWWHDGVPVTMHASTIHRALQMESVEDDEFVVHGAIECRGLVSEESSMDSSLLMAATLKSTSALHIIFIGDQHQLQPIGSGSPFRDMIAIFDRKLSDKLPTHSPVCTAQHPLQTL
jgi:ATP-dependent exoDNAse (exonuclease V) alpha subunit